nr:polyprenol phosphomannose-dependent alpha 1,6 mannosyltransferase MptB [Rhodococcus erythropolis]
MGVDHVLTRTVPTIWRDTPAPYGPFFLWLGRGISSLTGDNIVAGIFLHRLLALAGVALIVWAIPRLAKRCGVSAVSSLWLGAANPLLLFHLVAGIHNEALMLGLMLAGIEIALRAVEGSGPIRGRALFYLIAGSGLIALSSTVKFRPCLRWDLSAWPWLGVGVEPGKPWREPRFSWAIVAAVVTFVISVASGLGMGWINTLDTATAVRSWMSIPTLLGVGTGLAGVLLGLGDHTTAILTITRPIAYLVAILITARMMISVYMGRIHPVGGLGIALGAIVLLFPVVQPWYLLWAILPLAAWATAPIFRIPAVVFTSIVSVMLMSNGAEYLPFMIVQAVIATILTAGTLIVFTRNSLPWRSDKPVAEITKGGPVDEDNSAGAYADSP